MQLSKNFTLAELVRSNEADKAGVKNLPNDAEIKNLQLLCEHVLQPARDLLGIPIRVSSGFRSAVVNKLVGGIRNSQHRSGQAADIAPVGITIKEAFAKIAQSDIEFDQLIYEQVNGKVWIHISYSPRKRKQILYTVIENGKLKFRKWNIHTWN